MRAILQEGKFGVQEAVWLATITISAKVFFTSPATVAALVGTTGWYMTILSGLIALMGYLFVVKLLSLYPGKDLVQIFMLVLGTPLGFLFSALLATYLLFTAITRLAEFTEVTRIYVLPLSPNLFIGGIFVLGIYIIINLGLESIARLAKILIFPMLVGFIFVLIFAADNYQLSHLFPLFGYGIKKTVTVGIIRSGAYSEVIILAVFASSLQGIEYIKKEGLLSITFSTLFISISVLAFSLTFPYYTARDIIAPMYELASLIDQGPFLQRVEAIFLFIWIMSTVISTSAVLYSFVWIFCRLFKVTDKRPIILASCTLLYAGSLMHVDLISVTLGNVELIRRFGSLVCFGLPLLVLIVARLKRKGAANDQN